MNDQQPQRRRDLDPYVPDIFAVLGVGLVTAGAWLIYMPAGLIVCGVAFIVAAVLGARSRPVE